jgi:hypothetical protein
MVYTIRVLCKEHGFKFYLDPHRDTVRVLLALVLFLIHRSGHVYWVVPVLLTGPWYRLTSLHCNPSFLIPQILPHSIEGEGESGTCAESDAASFTVSFPCFLGLSRVSGRHHTRTR